MKIKQRDVRYFFSIFLTLSLIIANTAPVFAQLGDIMPPPVVTPPPVPIPPAPPAEVPPPPTEPVTQVITPPADTTAPVIAGVASLSLGITLGTIVWTTDELAISHLEYGITESYGTQAMLDATALLAHTAILTGLTANTTYHYCIHATDLAGNTANSCGHSFTTAAEATITDTTPPDVTLITEGPITTTSATIGFTTSEVGNARIEYGTTAGYGESTPLDTDLALTHSVTIVNLTPNTEYHYRIISSDEIGNETITSDETFMTEIVPTLSPVSSPGESRGGSVGLIIEIPADTTVPVISEVGSVMLGITNATLAWVTNELSTSTIEYGVTENYGALLSLSATALLAHTATLTGLSGGTTYYYCIHATDLAGNTANSCGHSFTTEPIIVSTVVDATPPQILTVTIDPITTTGAGITWTTNELGTSQIQYGATTNYGLTVNTGSTLSLTHSLTLRSLLPDTTYHYRFISTDVLGNSGISFDETFTTAAILLSPTPLVQVNATTPASTVVISGIETASISTSTVTIVWETDLPSDSQIEYGDSDNLGSVTTLDGTLTTSHSVTITGLITNTNYIFRVKSKPLGATAATVSENDEFDTLNHSTPVVAGPNILSVSFSSVTSSGATISWTTDKAATSQVEYGISTSYGEVSALDSSMVMTHSISLTNLESGTSYNFRVKSTDEVSNITYSEDYSFTTATSSVSVSTNQAGSQNSNINQSLNVSSNVLVAITTLAIGAYDENSVELVWNVASSNIDVAQEYDVRYSTSPITESNFASSTEAQLTPIYYGDLSPNGTERTYIVAGLDPNTIYYFALKSKHENSSYSGISNVVTVATTINTSVNNESVSQNTSSGNQGSGGGSPSTNSQPSQSSGGQAGSSGGGGGGYGGGSGGDATYSYVPTVVKAEPADNQIIFEWNNPGEINFVRTVIVKKEGGYPTSPSDGQTLYEGREKTFTDTNVQNGKTYYYALYSYNHEKIYSRGINVSLAPNAGNKEIKFNESGSLSSSTPALHFVRTWQKGDKDIEIEHLQEILSVDQVTYPEKYITGYFGSLTQAALRRFQTKHGLLETGVVDVATQKN